MFSISHTKRDKEHLKEKKRAFSKKSRPSPPYILRCKNQWKGDKKKPNEKKDQAVDLKMLQMELKQLKQEMKTVNKRLGHMSGSLKTPIHPKSTSMVRDNRSFNLFSLVSIPIHPKSRVRILPPCLQQEPSYWSKRSGTTRKDLDDTHRLFKLVRSIGSTWISSNSINLSICGEGSILSALELHRHKCTISIGFLERANFQFQNVVDLSMF